MPPGQVPRGTDYVQPVDETMDKTPGRSTNRRMYKRHPIVARSPQQQSSTQESNQSNGTASTPSPSTSLRPSSVNQDNTSPGNENNGSGGGGGGGGGSNQPAPPSFPPPGPSSPGSMFGCPICIARDNDLRVTYNGSWTLNGTPSSTSHTTTTPGASASFSFNGTGIVVFGTVPASNDTIRPPTAAYTIDSEPAHVTTLPTASRSITDQPLFASLQLSGDIAHTIVINIQTADTPFTLEYFFVFPTFPNSSMDVQVNTNIPVAPTAYTTQPPTTSGAVLMGQDESGNTVKILAGLLGCLVVLMIVGVVLFFFRRRNQGVPFRLSTTTSTTTNSVTLTDRIDSSGGTSGIGVGVGVGAGGGIDPLQSPPEKLRGMSGFSPHAEYDWTHGLTLQTPC
ncbi:hypothetical protein BDN72DRAFT_893943 [Pluteus cervinus]|uniref:Uncharacterized protein n=1 Tax=Pluteus cervinus TaxID=181527 RepID=A0ACD3B956_9AGAR|nr:hypothetical protein BDN72DRAFT_893943 [Pluteus cervinus]